MASVISELKNFFSRIRFGKLVCVLFTLAMLTCLTACDAPETNPEEGVDFEPTSNGCLVCPVFDIVYSAGETLCKTMHQDTAKPAVKLLAVAFGLWLAVYVMKFVGTLKEPDIAGFWNGLAIRTFWVALIGIGFLNNIEEVMDMLINPVFGAFLNVGTKVVSQLPAGSEGTISCVASDPKAGLLCIVTAAVKRFNQGPEIAVKMLPYVFINPMLVVSGCIAIVFSYLLIIVTPLYLLETVFCYFVVVALLPLWIVAYAFPITRGFTTKAWDYLMSVCIQMLGMCMFLGLSAQIFSILMKKSFPNPVAFFAGLLSDPLGAVVSPAVLIFVSYFIYLFGGVVLQVLEAVFGLATPKGETVKAMKNKATGAIKNASKSFEKETFGSPRDEAAKASKNNPEKTDPNSRMGRAESRLNNLEKQQNEGQNSNKGASPDGNAGENQGDGNEGQNSNKGASPDGNADEKQGSDAEG